MSAAEPLQGRSREQSEAEVLSALLRAWMAADPKQERTHAKGAEAAWNCSPSAVRAAATTANVEAHQ